MNWKHYLVIHREQLVTTFAIFIVSVISFGTFNSTIISSDDWSYFVAKYVFGNLHPVNLTDRRPLILTLYYALASAFGLEIEYYYIINFLILFFSALILYAVVKRAFPDHSWVASLVTLTYIIYPVDYSRTWIIMIYIRFWWLVSLGIIWLLMEFAKSGNKGIFAIAMLGILIPLGAYEGQFGIIALASILIACLTPNINIKRRIAVTGGILAIGFAFLIWRFIFQSKIFDIKDSYVGSLRFEPAILFERYLIGFKVFSVGWFDPIQAQLELSGFNLIRWVAVYFIICCILFVWISAKSFRAAMMDGQEKISLIKSYFIILLIGAAFWLAGFFPIITLYSPSLSGNASRVNSFAIPGASLVLVSTVSILATFIANSNFSKQFFVIVTILPFIVAGVYAQIQVNKENQAAWEIQKVIWNSVFEAVPNLQDQKKIVVIISGYQHLRPFESLPFLSAWEINAGTQILYNNPNIGGYYYYKDIHATELLFTKNGFRPIPSDKIVPYKKLAFVYYEPQSNTAELVENLEDTLSLPFEANNYNPHEIVVPSQPSTADWRWLVQ